MKSQNSAPAILLAVAALPALALAAPPTGTAYYTDGQHTFVQDATSQSIGQVNNIVCYMHAMRPDAMVNKGDYIALIDENKCDHDKQASVNNSTSTDGSALAASFTSAVVNSSRANNVDPMRARIWVNHEEQGQAGTIFVNLGAAQAPSQSDPYGTFRLDYCGRMGGGIDCLMRGMLQTGNGGLSFFANEGGANGARTTALKLSSVGLSSGSGRLDTSETNGTATVRTIFDFAYNQDYFLRGDQCFSRDAADAETGRSVWRYGLYDAVTGARVELNSGFPIEFTNGGTTYSGYLGYYGLSLPSAAAANLQSGATVTKVDYGNNGAATRTSYTVLRAGGKLTKFTRKTRTLRDIDQIHFNTFVGNVALWTGATLNTSYEMYWNEATGRFKVVGAMTCNAEGCRTATLAEQSVAPSAWSNLGGLHGSSAALGGDIDIDLRGATAPVNSAAITVSYREAELVYPADMPAQLHCVSNCDTAATLNAYFAAGSTVDNPYVPGTAYNFSQPTAGTAVVHYTTNPNQGVLIDGAAAPVVYTNADLIKQRAAIYRSGVRSGRLVANLADALCAPGATTYCESSIGSAAVYYQWETGSNSFNQLVLVRDAAGSPVRFDAPLQVTFDVPNTAAFGSYAGKSMVLQYGGFGNLWGIPGHCVSALTNLAASCDAANSRYVPDFVIPFDPVTGVVRAGNRSYLVKWLDREVRFARKPLSVCTGAGLTTPTGIVLPTAADVKNPSDPASDIYIGVKPVVTAAPRVIHGEVKY